MPRSASVVLLLGLAACMRLPQEPLPPSELPVQFQTLPLQQRVSFAVEGQAGAVIVQDQTITGECHRREDHGAYLRGTVLTFWVAHTGRRGTTCPDIGVLGAYRATIGDLPAGVYQVQVEYVGDVSTDTYPRPQLVQSITVR